jgi:hypothetical protein
MLSEAPAALLAIAQTGDPSTQYRKGWWGKHDGPGQTEDKV